MKTRTMGKTVFALLLSLATVCIAQGTEQYEPTYTKLKTVNNVLHYKIKAAPSYSTWPFFDESINIVSEELEVKYNPYRGLVKIEADNILAEDSLYAKIKAYDSDSMWIGKSDKLDLNYSYRDQFFLDTSEVKYVKYIKVELYYKETDEPYHLNEHIECRNYENLIFLGKNSKKIIYTCNLASLEKVGIDNPFSFYWNHFTKIDGISFIELTEYKTCDTVEYFGLDSSKNQCIERAQCQDYELYDSLDNSCYSIPEYSHSTGNRTWECNDGYVEKSDYCEAIPSNSHKTSDYEWECNDGYVRDWNNCWKIVSCDKPDEIYGTTDKTFCSTIPSNSHKTSDYEWNCNDGYVELDGSCEVKASCDTTQRYDRNRNICHSKPENSYWSYGLNWKCNDGYVELGFSCEVKASCDTAQRYNEESNICYSKPENSYWSYGLIWECNDGYVEKSDYCEAIPSNSHKTSNNGWNCNDGYGELNGSCVELPAISVYSNGTVEQARTAYVFNNTTLMLGYRTLRDNDNLYSRKNRKFLNFALEDAIGLKLGHDDFNLRGPQLMLGVSVNYVELPNPETLDDEYFLSTEFLGGFGIGINIWRFTFDYYYVGVRGGLESELISLKDTRHKIRIGLDITEHLNLNFNVMFSPIYGSDVLKNCDRNMLSFGISYYAF